MTGLFLEQEIKFTMVKHEKILHNKSSFGLKHESILDEIINSNNQDHSLMISNIEKIDNSLLHDYHSNKNISNLQHMHGHGNNKPIHIEEN